MTSIFNNISIEDSDTLTKEFLMINNKESVNIVEVNIDKIKNYYIECISSNNYDEKFIEDLTEKLIYELKFLTKK